MSNGECRCHSGSLNVIARSNGKAKVLVEQLDKMIRDSGVYPGVQSHTQPTCMYTDILSGLETGKDGKLENSNKDIYIFTCIRIMLNTGI